MCHSDRISRHDNAASTAVVVNVVDTVVVIDVVAEDVIDVVAELVTVDDMVEL
jgi:hypothetical protein